MSCVYRVHGRELGTERVQACTR